MAFILKKSLAFQPGFLCNSRNQLLQGFEEGILVSCFSVARVMSSSQEKNNCRNEWQVEIRCSEPGQASLPCLKLHLRAPKLSCEKASGDYKVSEIP